MMSECYKVLHLIEAQVEWVCLLVLGEVGKGYERGCPWLLPFWPMRAIQHVMPKC